MLPELEDWFARRTWQDPRWEAAFLVSAKRGRTVSVVLPALDEQDTVGGVVAAVRPLTRGPSPLVDELVVLDSGSTDATRRVAAGAGARVVTREQVLPDLGVRPGKGEVLWRSLAATTGDVIVFLDSDLVDVDARFVTSLLGPLLTAPGVELVKGFYRRPLRLRGAQAERTSALRGAQAERTSALRGAQAEQTSALRGAQAERPSAPQAAELETGGGRVTELLARPVITALRPRLAGVVQPLGGEYAATRELLESVPFAAGYGVELGLLIDAERTRGLDALAQVNLGVRKHRHRSLLQLGVMSRQILAAVLNRVSVPDSGAAIVQFTQLGGEWLPTDHPVETRDRPPMCEVLSDSAGPRPG